jgi:hypothetical protein
VSVSGTANRLFAASKANGGTGRWCQMMLRLLDQHPDRSQLIAWSREHGGPDWTDHLDKINAEADAAAVGAPN